MNEKFCYFIDSLPPERVERLLARYNYPIVAHEWEDMVDALVEAVEKGFIPEDEVWSLGDPRNY